MIGDPNRPVVPLTQQENDVGISYTASPGLCTQLCYPNVGVDRNEQCTVKRKTTNLFVFIDNMQNDANRFFLAKYKLPVLWKGKQIAADKSVMEAKDKNSLSLKCKYMGDPVLTQLIKRQ